MLQTEFTSLHQWQREYAIFEQLHNKLHFMHFRLWKQFALWRRAVRVRKTVEARCIFHLESDYVLCNGCQSPVMTHIFERIHNRMKGCHMHGCHMGVNSISSRGDMVVSAA